jgi:hypothetical protein
VKVTSTPLRGMAGYCQYPEKDSGKSSTIWGYNPNCGQCVESFMFPDHRIFP